MTIFYAFWLGLAMVGPFDTLAACQAAHRYQVAWGATDEVTECWTLITPKVTYSVAPPTYGAPLTEHEASFRLALPK